MQQKPSIDLDSEAAVILFRKKSASVAMKTVQYQFRFRFLQAASGLLTRRESGAAHDLWI